MKNHLFTILFILLKGIFFAQIPVNRFIQYSESEAVKGAEKIYLYDYNNDSRTDIFLLGSDTKNISSGLLKNTDFEINNSSNFSYIINDIQPYKNIENYGFTHLFVTRKTKTLGLVTLSNSGAFQIKNIVQLDSWPDKVAVDNFSMKKNKVAIVYGRTFDGITVITENNYSIRKNKIISNKSFNHATFMDFNYDGYSDFAAYNFITRSLEFYFNDTGNEFNFRRIIETNDDIGYLGTADINFDNYTDLVYSNSNKINVLFGDSVSSFANRLEIKTRKKAEDIEYADFNRDGFLDIAYLSKGSIYLIFGKNENEFYHDWLYCHDDKIRDISVYKNGKENLLIACSADGKIYSFSTLKKINSEFTVKLGLHPELVRLIKTNNKTSLLALDNGSRKLYIIDSFTTDTAKIYTFPMTQNFQNIMVGEINNKSYELFLYTVNKQWIEKINIELGPNSIKRVQLFVPAVIREIALIGKDERKILVLTEKNKNVIKLKYKINRTFFTHQGNDTVKIKGAQLRFRDVKKESFYSINKDVNRIAVYNSENKSTNNYYFPSAIDNFTIAGAGYHENPELIIAATSGNNLWWLKNSKLLAFKEDKTIKRISSGIYQSPDKLRNYYMMNLGFSDGTSVLYSVNTKRKKNILTAVTEKKTDSFSFFTFSPNNNFVIFTNSNNNTISFKKIK